MAEKDAAVRRLVFDEFLRNKRLEWDGYRTYVSPFELDRYLPLL